MQNESVCDMERICMYLENTQNAWKVKYLGEFEKKIENVLGGLSVV